MKTAKFWMGAALLSAVALAPSLADARHNRHHRHYHHNCGLPYHISYLHNYGPGLRPGTFAFYDGPSTILCRQSAAAYIGQDRRRYPCY
jgi:hypothetical protein